MDVVLDNGDRFKGVLFQETLSGHAIAHFADEAQAIVTSEFGKGRMMTIGTFLGTAYETDRDETLGKFIRSLLDWAHVRPGPSAPAGVEIRTLESGGDRIVVAFNHNNSAAEITLTGVDLETGAQVSRKALEPQGVLILRLTR